MQFLISNFLIIALFFTSCNDNSTESNDFFSTNPEVVAAGKSLFEKNCSSCHNFKQDGIGPALGRITDEVSVEWLYQFIRDPREMISSGDERTMQLQKKFKAAMPPFAAFKDDELDAIIAFLHANKTSPHLPKENENAIQDPIPEKIKLSSLVVNLEPVAQFPATGKKGNVPVTRIIKLSFPPNTGTLFVNDLRGQLYKLSNNRPNLYMDIAKLKPAFIDAPGLATGFGSFAFHPRFAENGIFYTTHTEAPGTGKADFSYDDSIKIAVQWVLTEWKTTNPSSDIFSGTSRELLRVNMVTGAHGVQEITFNPLSKPGDKDYGLLYIGVGDGASVQEGYSFLPQAKNSIWGTILCINPAGANSSNGKYGIPASNPFYKNSETKTIKEIYAYGFRNPHRITWSKAGEMLVCNIGQANCEAIYLVRPGQNCGWPVREGSFVINPKGNLNNVFPLPADDSVNKITYPIAEYDHDEGIAIAGGYEYNGTKVPQLNGKFLFGDIPSGRLFYITTTQIKQGKLATIKEWKITVNKVLKTLKQVCKNERVDLRFGQDEQGELYVLTKADGKLYKITSATEGVQ